MNGKELKRLKQSVKSVSKQSSIKVSKSLEPEFIGRVLDRLYSNAPECDTCKDQLGDFVQCISELQGRADDLSRQDYVALQKVMDGSVHHLQKIHKLVVAGQYVAVSVSVGLSLGVAVGVTFLDNVSLGVALGLVFGIAIGTALDAKAKKDNRLI